MNTDLTELLRDPDFAEPFHVTRREAVDDGGDDYRLEQSELEAVGSVQPATPAELERLPEEDRDKETIAVFTAFPLRAGGRGTARPDRITLLRSDATYLVVAVEPWVHLGCTWCRALAQRELA